MTKTYQELVTFSTYSDRLKYLLLNNDVGVDTFGYQRYLNQAFYRSDIWKRLRRDIILRDNGHDMGLDGDEYAITGTIYIHHINPLSPDDFISGSSLLTDVNNLISVSRRTHDAIHYGSFVEKEGVYVPRSENDTILWMKGGR